ncbi:amidohydrolase [Sulfolobus sp. A20]|uniref:metal-dependent hydrolase family protein n=1 Tax=Saccharolobus sp. A20 TaxID=1891280 RepID=UPI0008460777|nr:amidohydrolase family protein [Sulfolobus sp. A20]TRM76416.1 amidohydrolase family protein [Sulfolobus sp. E5]TRM76515.1 amidohydrolase family protein [Sulfolobus sp. A20-N-F8]TRM82205.1 amidohydrolase family protein [Sulfolobus sp. D5]TRM85205.1 amidohydrolase family protein [Sulfolobus sp. F3]TRM89455.1 amidohydrolase family protein [Sulfolobus sp. C3]TRN02699.1 amidohydrolase family protein [Sulfolobus sp. E1]TRN03067.1 amidohydrolase family protein [Sulfolobus sp. F1]
MKLVLVGKIFDGEKIIDKGTIIVEDDKITKVLEGIEKVDNAKIIEGDFIMPGLVDAHMHFFGVEEDNVMAWNLVNEIDVAIRSTRDMEVLLRSGFTAVRDLGSKVAVRLDKLQRRGEIIGPTVISSGFSLAITGGNDDPKELPIDFAQRISYSFYCDSPYECRKAVRMAIRQGATVIKVYASGAFSQGGIILPGFTLDELKAIVDESHRAGLKVASHAYGREAIMTSILAGVDTIEHGLGLDEETAQMIKERGICYIPTLATYQIPFESVNPEAKVYREEMIKRHFTDDMRIAMEHKLKIATGTDYVGSKKRPHGQNYIEAVILSRYMSNLEVLKASTSVASECIGLRSRGYVREGYKADLIVVKGNPLSNVEDLSPSHILYVVKDGKVFKGYGLYKELD